MTQAQSMPDAAVEAPEPTRRRKEKQAVVIVHGMGEQMPMETLRSFVETMWVDDPRIAPLPDDDAAGAEDPVGNDVWFKPDSRNDSAELWRITTRHEKSTGQRVDFFEFYWADVTASNTIDHLKDLFRFMLMRNRSQVPARVFRIWVILWTATIVFGLLSAWQALAAAGVLWAPGWVRYVLTIGGAVYAAAIGFVVAYLGDVARYCRAKPPNIAARRAIRERGLARLKALVESRQYDRIVLVGHSLGSIVAYDLLKLLWADWVEATPIVEGEALFAAFQTCKAKADELPKDSSASDAKLDAFRAAQYGVFNAALGDPRPKWIRDKELAKAQSKDPKLKQAPYTPWLISDFVTVGAALSHSQFLLAKDETEFRQGAKERRFPSIPPVADGQHGYVYEAGADLRKIDHGACFAAVRWTNIHDVSGSLSGDLVSGPVAGLFGAGARDVHVTIERETGSLSAFPRLFTHTLYWTDTRAKRVGAPPKHLVEMRDALDLVRTHSPPA